MLACEVEDTNYPLSKSATVEYGLLEDIIGTNKCNILTGIGTYTKPTKLAAYDTKMTKQQTMNKQTTHEHTMSEQTMTKEHTMTKQQTMNNQTTHEHTMNKETMNKQTTHKHTTNMTNDGFNKNVPQQPKCTTTYPTMVTKMINNGSNKDIPKDSVCMMKRNTAIKDTTPTKAPTKTTTPHH